MAELKRYFCLSCGWTNDTLCADDGWMGCPKCSAPLGRDVLDTTNAAECRIKITRRETDIYYKIEALKEKRNILETLKQHIAKG